MPFVDFALLDFLTEEITRSRKYFIFYNKVLLEVDGETYFRALRWNKGLFGRLISLIFRTTKTFIMVET